MWSLDLLQRKPCPTTPYPAAEETFGFFSELCCPGARLAKQWHDVDFLLGILFNLPQSMPEAKCNPNPAIPHTRFTKSLIILFATECCPRLIRSLSFGS